MSNERQLLQLLADGRFHSGQTLAHELGISRAAVWKRLQHLQLNLGLEIYAVTGKGYRLTRPLRLFDKVQVSDALKQCLPVDKMPEIDICLTVDSTNRHVLELSRQAPQRSRLSLAERQTAGRGRRGRHWVSPFGCNLYLSLYWWFDAMPPAMSSLSLASAVVLAECLEGVGVPRCELKWPNDVRYQGKKLAGILLEMQGEAGGGCGLVIGIGVNLGMQEEVGLESIDQPWTDVKAITGTDIDRHQFTVLLVSNLIELLDQYAQEAPHSWHAKWQQRDVLQGQSVRLELVNDNQLGIAQGVDTDGALLLEQNGQLRRFFSGDVSVRLAEQTQ